MSSLLPRLDRESIASLVATMEAHEDKASFEGEPLVLPAGVTYGRSGGAPVTPGELGALRRRIEIIAGDCGWPEQRLTTGRAMFDSRVAAALAVDPLFSTGDAHREDVWGCIATCVMPHLVMWRFGCRPERFHGGIRNTFQRLQVRGRLLDRGEAAGPARWGLLDALGEDALFNLSERPALAADSRLAKAIAEGWIRSEARVGRTSMEPIARTTIMQLRLLNEVRLLTALSDDALAAVVDDQFGRAEAIRDDERS